MSNKLILPEGTISDIADERQGIFNQPEYTIYIGKDYTQGLLTVQERCISHYTAQPSAAQQRLFSRFGKCMQYADTAPSSSERYAFALEAAHTLKEIAKHAEMKFTINIVENYTPPVEELMVYNRPKTPEQAEKSADKFELLEEYNEEQE